MSYSVLFLGSYNEAKAKEITATQKSDLSSEHEDLGRGKRVRRMTRPFSPGTENYQGSSSCSEDESASQVMENGLPPAPFLKLPVAHSTALFDESTSATQEICSQFISKFQC